MHKNNPYNTHCNDGWSVDSKRARYSMFNQMTKTFFDFNRKNAEAALEANQIAAKTASELFDKQLKLAEENTEAAAQYWQDAGEIRDAEGTVDFVTRGSELLRDGAGKLMEAGNETLELGLKSQEQITDLFQGNAKAATAGAKKATAKTTK